MNKEVTRSRQTSFYLVPLRKFGAIPSSILLLLFLTCSSLSVTLRDWRDSRKSLGINNFCSVSLGLDNHKFSSLKKSQSQQLTNSGSQKVSVSTNFNFDFQLKIVGPSVHNEFLRVDRKLFFWVWTLLGLYRRHVDKICVSFKYPPSVRLPGHKKPKG